jgi:hypothetical protein
MPWGRMPQHGGAEEAPPLISALEVAATWKQKICTGAVSVSPYLYYVLYMYNHSKAHTTVLQLWYYGRAIRLQYRYDMGMGYKLMVMTQKNVRSAYE